MASIILRKVCGFHVWHCCNFNPFQLTSFLISYASYISTIYVIVLFRQLMSLVARQVVAAAVDMY